jgi:hypothetical protein
MADDPWVPPYFGSYQELVQYVLTHPLDSGGVRPPSRMAAYRKAPDPGPDPWGPPYGPVASLVNAVNVKALAATVSGPARQQLEVSANAAIEQILDDYCGTPPRVYPWPWPGPPPWVYVIASELNAIANTMEAGRLREGLTEVAGLVLQRGLAQSD